MNPIIQVFSEFAHATRAREALLNSGFAIEQVSLEARDEEAGPVQGDFILANKGYARVPSVQRGTLLMMVEILSDAQQELAVAILAEASRDDDGERMEH